MTPIVSFENVGLRYGVGGETLSGLDLALPRGSFHFLTGASGAGKTSLLNLVTLAQRPSRGLVRLFGEDVGTAPRAALPAFRRRIGTVHQDFRLVADLSVFDNVALPLRIAGLGGRAVADPVMEMLHWVGLGGKSRARPATLSGGEQQRVAIARAVIARPELIVADEPTGSVDPDMGARLLGLFEGLNRLGATVLIATHDPHAVGRIKGAGLLRLKHGRLLDPVGAQRHPPRVHQPA